MPNRVELQGQVVGLMLSPARKIASCLTSPASIRGRIKLLPIRMIITVLVAVVLIAVLLFAIAKPGRPVFGVKPYVGLIYCKVEKKAGKLIKIV